MKFKGVADLERRCRQAASFTIDLAVWC